MDHDYGYHLDKSAAYRGDVKEAPGAMLHLPGGYDHCSPTTRADIDHRKKWQASEEEKEVFLVQINNKKVLVVI